MFAEIVLEIYSLHCDAAVRRLVNRSDDARHPIGVLANPAVDTGVAGRTSDAPRDDADHAECSVGFLDRQRTAGITLQTNIAHSYNDMNSAYS